MSFSRTFARLHANLKHPCKWKPLDPIFSLQFKRVFSILIIFRINVICDTFSECNVSHKFYSDQIIGSLFTLPISKAYSAYEIA